MPATSSTTNQNMLSSAIQPQSEDIARAGAYPGTTRAPMTPAEMDAFCSLGNGEQPGLPATSQTTFVCDDCGKVYKTKDGLVRHRNAKHGDGHVFGCQHPACQFVYFVYHPDLVEHHREVHGIQPPKEFGKRPRTPKMEIEARKRELCARCGRHLPLGTKEEHEKACADFRRKPTRAPKRPIPAAPQEPPAKKRRIPADVPSTSRAPAPRVQWRIVPEERRRVFSTDLRFHAAVVYRVHREPRRLPAPQTRQPPGGDRG